jgi:DNA-binding IclR family transcriptional regulator
MAPLDASAPLQTVDRALEVLLSFSEYRQEWGVMELSGAYGIPRSTAQRLLAALAGRGFLVANARTRRYSLGPAVWRMAALWERSGGLAALVTPILAQLSESSGRTSVFCVPDGTYVRCVAAVSGQEGPRRGHPYLDELYPANAGASSRGYFAFLDAGERYGLLHGRPFARFSGLTAADERELERLFDETAAQGYAFSEGEWDESTRAVAMPVFSGQRPVGSVTLVENKSAEHARAILDHLDVLKATTGAITGYLSNHPPAPPRRDWRRRATPRPTS